MKRLLENFRAFAADTSQKNQKYFDQAIQTADTYDDYGWSIDDFDIEHIGMMSLESLEEIVPFGEWVKNMPAEFEGMPPEQRVDSVEEFDSSEKKDAARTYIERPDVRPPVVIVTAPDSNHDSQYTRIGYGTGLINLHIVLGLSEIEVYHLKYVHEVKKAPRGLPGPAGRLEK
jgi:hypothetical protein